MAQSTPERPPERPPQPEPRPVPPPQPAPRPGQPREEPPAAEVTPPTPTQAELDAIASGTYEPALPPGPAAATKPATAAPKEPEVPPPPTPTQAELDAIAEGKAPTAPEMAQQSREVRPSPAGAGYTTR